MEWPQWWIDDIWNLLYFSNKLYLILSYLMLQINVICNLLFIIHYGTPFKQKCVESLWLIIKEL